MQNSGVTPEIKSLKKRAPANKNHKVKAEKKKVVGFSERCRLIASVCESGAGAKDFVANFCAEETETIIRGKNAHCSTTQQGMLRIARAGGRAGKWSWERFFSWRNIAKKRNSKLNFLKRTDFGGF